MFTVRIRAGHDHARARYNATVANMAAAHAMKTFGRKNTNTRDRLETTQNAKYLRKRAIKRFSNADV